MPVLPRQKWPARMLRSWALRGIFTGGCIARGDGSSFRAKAHAHTGGRHEGWICVRRADRVADEMLMLHELAHIITGHGHTDTWRACLVRIGGKLEPHEEKHGRGLVLRDYHKQPRRGDDAADPATV